MAADDDVVVNALERNDRREENEEESMIECCCCTCCFEDDEGALIPKPSVDDRKQSVATTQAEMKEGEKEDNDIIIICLNSCVGRKDILSREPKYAYAIYLSEETCHGKHTAFAELLTDVHTTVV